MAEVLGLVASFIAIGQVLAAVPKAIDSLRSLRKMKNEIATLISELELLRSAKEYIDDALNGLARQSESTPISTSEPEFCRTVKAQLEDVMSQTSKLIADCHRGFDKRGQPRQSRTKWLWKKNNVDRLCAAARQARLDLHLIVTGHMWHAQRANERAMLDFRAEITAFLVTNQAQPQNVSVQPQESSESSSSSVKSEISNAARRRDVPINSDSTSPRTATIGLNLMNPHISTPESLDRTAVFASSSETIRKNVRRPTTSKTLHQVNSESAGPSPLNPENAPANLARLIAAAELVLLSFRRELHQDVQPQTSLQLSTSVHDNDNVLQGVAAGEANQFCGDNCSCQCHRRRHWISSISSPIFLRNILGTLNVNSRGLFLGRCNHLGCVSPRSLDLHYQFPFWTPTRRYLQIEAIKKSSAYLHVRIGSVASLTDSIWAIIRDGDLSSLIEKMQSQQIEANTIDENGTTVLYAALLSRQFEIISFLLTAGSRIDQRTADLSRDILSSIYNPGAWPESSLEILRQLSKHEGATDAKSIDYSGIHAAAKGLHNLGLQLEDDAQSLDELDDYGKAALHWACQGGNDAVVKLLITAGASVNVEDHDGETPLMTAANRGNVQCIRALLADQGCVVSKVNRQGRSALHYAASSPYIGSHDVVKLLLRRGANPSLANRGGETPLHELASSYTLMVPTEELRDRSEAILQAGASLEDIDYWNYTPALQAVAEDNQTALGVLLGLGAQTGGVDCDKQGILHLTALYGGLETIQTLKEAQIAGLDIESLDYQQDTPFGLFSWRLVANLPASETWARTPSEEEHSNFGALLWEVRNRNLEADLACCYTVIQALNRDHADSATSLLSQLVEKYARWDKEEELKLFQTIKMMVDERSSESAIRILTDLRKIWTTRMEISPLKQ